MDDYEYDSPSDSDDDEPVGTETFWHEIYKRIKCHLDDVHIQLLENDDTSVLAMLLDVIHAGVSAQFIAVQCQLENVHNAIVHNPSKRAGPQRLDVLKQLQTLLSPDLYLDNVTRVDIANAEDYRPEHVELLARRVPHLHSMSLVSPTPRTLQSLFMFRELKHLRVDSIHRMPNIYTLDDLETITVSKVRLVDAMWLREGRARLHLESSLLDESVCAMVAKRYHVTCADIQVSTVDGVVDYEVWKHTDPWQKIGHSLKPCM